jgi:hypothetical protein
VHAYCERNNVRVAALILWSATAVMGCYLLISWLFRGGARRPPAKVTRYPVIPVVGHPVLALTGLGLWIWYVTSGEPAYAWGAFGVLCVAALLGFTLLTRWFIGIGGRHAKDTGSHRGFLAVLLHGFAGITTFALVLITATIMRHG